MQYNSNRTWVSDDEPILGQIERDLTGMTQNSAIISVITSDKKLCNLVCRRFLCETIQVTPRNAVKFLSYLDEEYDFNNHARISDDIMRGIKLILPKTARYAKPLHLYLDTGSWAAELVRYDGDPASGKLETDPKGTSLRVRELLSTGVDRVIDRRFEEFRTIEVPNSSRLEFTILNKKDEVPRLTRRFPSGSTNPITVIEVTDDDSLSMRSSMRESSIHSQYKVFDFDYQDAV